MSTDNATNSTDIKQAFKELLASVPANPAELKFPTDKWGFTSAIKREVLRAASSVRGQENKHELLVMTLAILIQHIHARKDRDAEIFAEALARRRQAQETRAPREIFSGLSDPTRATGEVVNTKKD